VRKYSIKYILFFLPFIIAICIELFVLPIDYFTFRVWETLSTRRSFGVLKGPFYTDMIISKTENGGDLDSRTRCAMKKDVTWITDQYGYRKDKFLQKRYPVIVVGDSNFVGTGITPDDTLANIL
jgi:alginate O-acetyltransferase complex protein AlgJ